MTSVVVNVIYEVPGLPYRESYAQWEHHINHCTECQLAIVALRSAGLLRDPTVLCPTGQELDSDLAERINFQREASGSN